MVRPPGAYNDVRIVVRGGHVEHWLNDRKVVTYDRFSAEFKSLIVQSKFKDIPTFGQAKRGRILLQDQGNAVCFRNVKLRPLP